LSQFLESERFKTFRESPDKFKLFVSG